MCVCGGEGGGAVAKADQQKKTQSVLTAQPTSLQLVKSVLLMSCLLVLDWSYTALDVLRALCTASNLVSNKIMHEEKINPFGPLYKNCLIYFDAAVRNAPSTGLFFSITWEVAVIVIYQHEHWTWGCWDKQSTLINKQTAQLVVFGSSRDTVCNFSLITIIDINNQGQFLRFCYIIKT
jgi:hypothetical protein